MNPYKHVSLTQLFQKINNKYGPLWLKRSCVRKFNKIQTMRTATKNWVKHKRHCSKHEKKKKKKFKLLHKEARIEKREDDQNGLQLRLFENLLS